ncbi:MAG: hypothetical protein LBK63_02300 [Treponema sp.]|jgi:hypothetical protein|nr:hypothetical protein [Treponema sp.]
MALAFGITVVGCDNGSTSYTANTDPKAITITGLTCRSGNVEIILGDIVNNDDKLIANGQGTISNNFVTVSLKNNDSSDWTGTGSYMIQLKFASSQSYWFTNGKTWVELGITASASEGEVFRKLPKYGITSAASTIAFDQFKEQP